MGTPMSDMQNCSWSADGFALIHIFLQFKENTGKPNLGSLKEAQQHGELDQKCVLLSTTRGCRVCEME
jgi:hypothetical protein